MSVSGADARALKRAIDVVAAVVLLVLCSPVLALAAVAIRVTMGAPVLFRQLRPGLRQRPFVLLKLRTMREPGEGGEDGSQDRARLTRVGSFLRRMSIDELPQLLNVLRGEMSLVGPRPLLMEYLPLYDAHQARRHEVRPGITGWAQVRGRNALSWEEKFSCDIWYVDHVSTKLDLEILALTVLRVLKRGQVSAPGYATMPRFIGSRRDIAPPVRADLDDDP